MRDVITDAAARANIAANIQRLRERHDLSRYGLAKLVNATTIQITRIERGDHVPGPALLSRIAEALKTSTDKLILTPAEKSLATA